MHAVSVKRHRWIERERLFDRTRRQCQDCGLWKVTRHEPHAMPPHWVEFYCGEVRVAGDKTPACEPVEVQT